MSLGRHHDVIWYISYCNQLGNNVLSNLQVSRQWRQYFRIYRRGVGAFEATPPPTRQAQELRKSPGGIGLMKQRENCWLGCCNKMLFQYMYLNIMIIYTQPIIYAEKLLAWTASRFFLLKSEENG